MTQEDHVEAWRRNISGKSLSIRNQINAVLSLLPGIRDSQVRAEFDGALDQLMKLCFSLRDLYSSNQVPRPLQRLTERLTAWQSNFSDPNVLRSIIELYDPIGELVADNESGGTSFTDILERHREDKTLHQYLAQLIQAIEELLAEGDAVLSNQAAKELNRIVSEIRRRKKQSLVDLSPWLEFGLISLASIADHVLDTPIAGIVAAGVLAAKKAQLRARELFREAEREYVDSLDLKGKDKWHGGKRTALIECSLQEVEAALNNPQGIRALETTRKALPGSDSSAQN